MPHPADRKQGALMAALLGDALGVPYEFHDAESLPPPGRLDMTPPAGFDRSHRRVPPGTWSDDGAQILALLDSLQTRHPFDPSDFARKLLAWWQKGAYTPDGLVFDVGIQTRRALEALERGVLPLEAGGTLMSDNGNGALMRTLPVGFFDWPAAKLIDVARKQSRLTHGHVRSQLCCALYALLVQELVHGASKAGAMQAVTQTLSRHLQASERAEFDLIMAYPQRHIQLGNGYVVDCLWSAWTAFTQSTGVLDGLRAAVAMGKDTDTTACVAGGLLGAFYGKDAVPLDLWSQLRGTEKLVLFLHKLD